jgi:hypothetical protein
MTSCWEQPIRGKRYRAAVECTDVLRYLPILRARFNSIRSPKRSMPTELSSPRLVYMRLLPMMSRKLNHLPIQISRRGNCRLMNAAQAYFSYTTATASGIPLIHLRGTLADWQMLRTKVLYLVRVLEIPFLEPMITEV